MAAGRASSFRPTNDQSGSGAFVAAWATKRQSLPWSWSDGIPSSASGTAAVRQPAERDTDDKLNR
jgi:hypothetical protein